MLGAIAGDIIGSFYEMYNIKTKEFPLFHEHAKFTDDTVMTVAVSEGLISGGKPEDYIGAMKKYGRLYPRAGYGGNFMSWLFSDDTKPYNSWGNGAAMRVSPVAWAFSRLEDVEKAAAISASVTHNHPEGIKGAQAAASATFLARTGASKDEIKAYITKSYGYNLERALREIRPAYRFDVSCQGTVPEAIIAFLESTDFEDAVRNAISLGGDSDTLAAITGGIAEAAYGVPEEIQYRVCTYLDQRLACAYDAFVAFIN